MKNYGDSTAIGVDADLRCHVAGCSLADFHANFGDQMQMILFMKNVAIAGGLVVIAGVVSLALRLELEARLGLAAIRTVVQLILIGYLLEWIFDIDSAPVLAAVIAVMVELRGPPERTDEVPKTSPSRSTGSAASAPGSASTSTTAPARRASAAAASSSASAEVGADLIPGVGRPVLRAAILDHLDPLGVELLRHIRVHGRRQLAVIGHVQVDLIVVGVARQEARVDRRPGARATHTDTVAAIHRGLGCRCGLDQLVEGRLVALPVGKHILAVRATGRRVDGPAHLDNVLFYGGPETIRGQVEAISVRYGDKSLPGITVSIGVALSLAAQGIHILRVHDVQAVRHALLGFAATGGLDERH